MNKPSWLEGVITADSIARVLRYCLIPALVFYLIALAVMSASGFNMIEILRDPAQQTGQSAFLGAVSTLGTWLWLSAAVFCLFRVASGAAPLEPDHRSLLKLAGGFSFFLALDDFFLIHDRYITEGILIPAYALFLAYLIKRFWALIRKMDGLAFLSAGTMLFFSVLVDAVQEILPIPYGASQALEEGFKFLGAAAWAFTCYRLAAWGLQRR
ncbi:hypothetical protein EI983_01950 [Roseovarius faecimaris]|uniref:Oxidase n=1 Tax=Roseovarius faecimaris TaxID=2494550 RepID=A0A6I6ILZ6_9RHOB|nr:hypothetical protein [Roseovarius faecimaris]QGX97104.1 hypothetical protein EI983_01950 [Roseovarius faecimaris]